MCGNVVGKILICTLGIWHVTSLTPVKLRNWDFRRPVVFIPFYTRLLIRTNRIAFITSDIFRAITVIHETRQYYTY